VTTQAKVRARKPVDGDVRVRCLGNDDAELDERSFKRPPRVRVAGARPEPGDHQQQRGTNLDTGTVEVANGTRG